MTRVAGSARRSSAAAVFVLLALVLPAAAGATPAYGRRYEVSCGTCHAPLPPRLNNVGILFRKAGFRMPDADDEGNLTFKTVAAQGVSEAGSLLADVAARRDRRAAEGESRTTFELVEVEAVAGTALGPRLSVQAMFVPWEDGEVELEDVEIQYNGGPARRQVVVRGGLMQTYLWQKANHGALTLTTPLLLGSRGVEEIGAFEGFGLGANQIGAEAGYVASRLAEGRLSSTMVTAALLNGVDREGEAARRNTAGGADLYLQALHLFGARNTVGGYYYRGSTFLEPESDEEEGTEHRFERYGVVGNYLLFDRLDLVVGAGQGRDESPLLAAEVRSRGFFTELVAQPAKRWIALYRFDAVDPDRDEDGASISAHTVSSTFQVEDHLYLTAEYQRLRREDETDAALVVNVRLIY